MAVRLTVAAGFEGLIDVLVSLPAVGQMLDFSDASPVETWVTEEVGAGGFDAVAPRFNEDRMAIGALLAAQAEGATDWQIGLVRRIEKRADDSASLAVEVIARAPLATEMRLRIGETADPAPEIAILLTPPQAGQPVDVLLRAGVNAAANAYLLGHEGIGYVLVPDRLVSRGADYELVRCAVQRDAA